MRHMLKTGVRRLSRNAKGSVYVEMAVTLMVLFGLFIGTAAFGTKTIDADRDARAMRSGVDLLHILDTDSSAPAQDDFDTLGQKIGLVAGFDATEDFAILFTVMEYDHLGGGLRQDWQGEYGSIPMTRSRLGFDADTGLVTVDGIDFDLRDDERMLVVEMIRTHRGMFVEAGEEYYSKAVAIKYDPAHL